MRPTAWHTVSSVPDKDIHWPCGVSRVEATETRGCWSTACLMRHGETCLWSAWGWESKGELFWLSSAAMRKGSMMKEPDSSVRCTGLALIRHKLHYGALPGHQGAFFSLKGTHHRGHHCPWRSSQLDCSRSNIIELSLLWEKGLDWATSGGPFQPNYSTNLWTCIDQILSHLSYHRHIFSNFQFNFLSWHGGKLSDRRFFST